MYIHVFSPKLFLEAWLKKTEISPLRFILMLYVYCDSKSALNFLYVVYWKSIFEFFFSSFSIMENDLIIYMMS